MPVSANTWQMDLKISPDHPRMVRPLTFMLHITDEQGKPVNDAAVSGAITMKEMDMGTTQLKFTPMGNGEYEASMKSMDMSGTWNLAVEAAGGTVHTKKSFEFTVSD
jgi:nitrogen fixation protein FixH